MIVNSFSKNYLNKRRKPEAFASGLEVTQMNQAR
jgi:hypothetical protein